MEFFIFLLNFSKFKLFGFTSFDFKRNEEYLLFEVTTKYYNNKKIYYS